MTCFWARFGSNVDKPAAFSGNGLKGVNVYNTPLTEEQPAKHHKSYKDAVRPSDRSLNPLQTGVAGVDEVIMCLFFSFLSTVVFICRHRARACSILLGMANGHSLKIAGIAVRLGWIAS